MDVYTVLLQDLPSKISHCLQRSVTWTVVDGTFPAHRSFRKLTDRVARLGRRCASLLTALPRLGRHP
jgi:hypothetical protein